MWPFLGLTIFHLWIYISYYCFAFKVTFNSIIYLFRNSIMYVWHVLIHLHNLLFNCPWKPSKHSMYNQNCTFVKTLKHFFIIKLKLNQRYTFHFLSFFFFDILFKFPNKEGILSYLECIILFIFVFNISFKIPGQDRFISICTTIFKQS